MSKDKSNNLLIINIISKNEDVAKTPPNSSINIDDKIE